MFSKVRKFIGEVIIELKKVTWGGRGETFSAAVSIIILILFVVVITGIIDFGLSRIFGLLFR